MPSMASALAVTAVGHMPSLAVEETSHDQTIVGTPLNSPTKFLEKVQTSIAKFDRKAVKVKLFKESVIINRKERIK